VAGEEASQTEPPVGYGLHSLSNLPQKPFIGLEFQLFFSINIGNLGGI